MAKWKLFAKNVLRAVGFPLHKLPVVRPPMQDYWMLDPELRDIYTRIASNTVVDRERVMMLRQFALNTAQIPGDAAEAGVYRGGTARLIAETFRNSGKKILLFDTFAGMPEVSATRDTHTAGDFGDTSLEQVKSFLADLADIEFYQGLFPETAAPVSNRTFCFVHVDVDLYQSTLDCCQFFYPRLSRGGVIIFDDYGYLSCKGAKEAADAFFADKPETPILLLTGQAFVIKRSG